MGGRGKKGKKCSLRVKDTNCRRPFGAEPRNLPADQLPTWSDVGLALDKKTNTENVSITEAVKLVTQEIINIYDKASIPTTSYWKVYEKVQRVVKLKIKTPRVR